MLTTDQKGAVAETAIAFAAIKLGIGVYRPLFEGGRFDLIFEVGGELYRIQCKWAPRAGDTPLSFVATRPGALGMVCADARIRRPRSMQSPPTLPTSTVAS
jgi:PD-(D/E)XK endonuclease